MVPNISNRFFQSFQEITMNCCLLLLITFLNWSFACDTRNPLTCKLDDSIIIADASNCSSDGSITCDGVVYPKGTYGTLDDDDSVLRGCICKIKVCVRLCCPNGHIFDDVNCIAYEAGTKFEVKIDQSDQTSVSILNLNQHPNYVFLNQSSSVCKHHFPADEQFQFLEVFIFAWIFCDHFSTRRIFVAIFLLHCRRKEFCLKTNGKTTMSIVLQLRKEQMVRCTWTLKYVQMWIWRHCECTKMLLQIELNFHLYSIEILKKKHFSFNFRGVDFVLPYCKC